MEKKQRVPKGEKYYSLDVSLGDTNIVSYVDDYVGPDNKAFKNGNYFCAKEEAEVMAKKLRAVLRGADVIEMPSEEEIANAQKNIEDEVVFNVKNFYGQQLIYCTAINKGAELMAKWLLTKIVK